jgi:hypothetical protein
MISRALELLFFAPKTARKEQMNDNGPKVGRFPIRCFPIRCFPIRCFPIRCFPIRCFPIRCFPIRCCPHLQEVSR